MPNTKQVIVMRADLRMRRGKEIAQGSHASMAFITKQVSIVSHRVNTLTPVQIEWLASSFRKVCVRVDSEAELLLLQALAKQAGLFTHLVQDNGLTEFGGVPTYTCLAIGPDYDEKIDPITGHLRLY